jgi:K+-sensing histidine kinase KdpD
MTLAAQTNNLNDILTLSADLLDGTLKDNERTYLEVVQRNATTLKAQDVSTKTLAQVVTESHDLNQSLTGIVGYSALLNSPKLADHASLSAAQLVEIGKLHDMSRYLHWWLDSLILLAKYIVRDAHEDAPHMGLLDIGSYLVAQAEHYVCRSRFKTIRVRDDMPFVYGNDTQIKTMIRGVFVSAMNLQPEAELHLNAYPMRRFIRAKIITLGKAAPMIERVAELLQAEALPIPQGSTPVGSLSLAELGMEVASHIAKNQNGRLKIDATKDTLHFLLTLPAEPIPGDHTAAAAAYR